MGAIFVDAQHLLTPVLEAWVDRVAQGYPGFYLGRFDLRVPDQAALREARAIQVIELNGVTSEPVHIYDPSYSIVNAWRTLPTSTVPSRIWT
jgi:hypothetical protein